MREEATETASAVVALLLLLLLQSLLLRTTVVEEDTADELDVGADGAVFAHHRLLDVALVST